MVKNLYHIGIILLEAMIFSQEKVPVWQVILNFKLQ
jgi:hypothetical protein